MAEQRVAMASGSEPTRTTDGTPASRAGVRADPPWVGSAAGFEFRTLGCIDLRGRNSRRIEAILQHPKRLSLLAYLCVPCPRMHRRDTLVALLWPDRDAAHARSALRQELYQIRRALGPGVLHGDRAAAVGIDRSQLWCDAQQFEAALDAGRPDDALALWDGEFLPGLHVTGGEFERWVDRMRERLRNRAVDAARQLAEEAEAAGDEPRAAGWARRLTELAPYDETGWRRLIALLDRQGDRSGALKVFDDMAARLVTEMEVEPSPETLVLVHRIRARGDALATPAAAVPVERPPALRRSLETGGRAVIGILPVENRTGDATLEGLAWRVTDRLAQGLAGAMFVEIAPIGETGPVTALVSAALYRRDHGLEVVPRLAEPGEHGRLVEMPRPVRLSTAAPDVELDTLVAHVLASVAAHYDPRFDAAATPERGLPIRTPTWEAYLEYLQGSELYGRYQVSEGYRHLRRAHELDPDFVKAGIFAAIALAESGEPAQAASLARSVMARSRPLSEYERTFGELFLADLHGRRADAYRVAQEAATSGHPALLLMAGREALRMNRPHEALVKVEALAARAMDRGWWRNRTEPWEVLCGTLHVLGHHRRELAAALDGLRRHPGRPGPIRAEVRARAALGESDRVLSLMDEALALPTGPAGPADIAWGAVQELTAHGQAAEAAGARRTALEWLMRRPALSLPERQVAVRLLLESGDVDTAAAWLAPLAPFEDLESLGLAALTAASSGDCERARQVLATLEGLTNPYLSGRHLLLAAEARVVIDPPEAAMAVLRRAFAAGLPFDVDLHARPGLGPLAPRADFRALLRPRD